MKTPFLLSIIVLLVAQNLIAQNQESRAYIIEHTNVSVLKELSQKYKSNYAKHISTVKEKSIDSTVVYKNGGVGYLAGFDKAGNPRYDIDDNIDAAISCRVDRIWGGGSSGLDLDGTDVQIGQWESGLAMRTHQELNGRIMHGQTGNVSSHATRMAGTMIGTGINNSARGMAANATILSFTSSNDEPEVAIFGSNGGILSNHSYSTGNPDGDIPHYGQYSESSREWDEIFYNAPYLSTCKSAGNNRNDGVNLGDGGYDLIYTLSAAKNIITIGAVNDIVEYFGPQSVVQSSFSNWGPTDDWRIKPDMVTNGVDVLSGNNLSPSSYSSHSGTSQASAAAAGALALLQQHFHNSFARYMKSATVKALVLSTTDEAGQYDGPDFQNGWGLLNAERAAQVISNHGVTSRISELSLENGETYTTTIETDGQSPLSLMIAWTDPPGVPLPVQLDNLSPILVNDLDVRLSNDSEVYEPWMMVPNSNNFGQPASKGDNFRDNLERIDVANIEAGIYEVTVSHKAALTNGKQDFSLVINGIIADPASTNSINDSTKDFLIYPNPSSDGVFNISALNKQNQVGYFVKVYNCLGKLCHQEYCPDLQCQIDLSHYSNDLYFMQISSNTKNHTQAIHISK